MPGHAYGPLRTGALPEPRAVDPMVLVASEDRLGIPRPLGLDPVPAAAPRGMGGRIEANMGEGVLCVDQPWSEDARMRNAAFPRVAPPQPKAR
jgi:hypothetical protein